MSRGSGSPSVLPEEGVQAHAMGTVHLGVCDSHEVLVDPQNNKKSSRIRHAAGPVRGIRCCAACGSSRDRANVPLCRRLAPFAPEVMMPEPVRDARTRP